MPLYDQHVHSRLSCDCEADAEENVRQAIASGLAGLTFTEHFDTHPDEWPACRYNDDAHEETIRRLRAKYGAQIFIGKGIEVCCQPRRMDFILDFLSRHRFDLVILSVHYFHDKTIHDRKHWAELDPAQGSRRYLETVREAVRLCERLRRSRGRVFDVLGHLDLIKRYTQRFFECYDMSPHVELVDEILQTCLEADLVPEINTSSLRQGLDETMPGAETVRRYARLGGTAMPIGSDAHLAASVGAGLDRAVAMLRAAGLRHTAVFTDRQRADHPIEL